MKVTLKGVLVYPWLNRLDTQFNSDGEFKTQIKTRQDTHAAIAEQLEAELQRYIDSEEAKKRNKGRVPRQHPDGLPFSIDDEDGSITFSAKSKVYRNKEGQYFTFPFAVFARDKTPLGVVKVEDGEVVIGENVPTIGGGTKAVVSVEVTPWVVSGKAGVSLRPRAIKIVELVERSGDVNPDEEFGDDDDEEFGSTSNSAPEGMEDDLDNDDF